MPSAPILVLLGMSDKAYYKDQIKQKLGVEHGWTNSSIPGCLIIEATWTHFPCPIGTVWYSWRGKATIEIYDSYVSSDYRRLGVRTFLHEKMIEAYPKLKAIVTGMGTRESTPWLRKMGFKRNAADGWRLDIKRS